MTTNNPPYVPIQHQQHNFVQNAQVCITHICDVPLFSYIPTQTLGGRDHELWSNEHLPGIDRNSAGPYPAANHGLPPTRYTSTTGNEDLPHVAIVHRGNQCQRQLDTNHATPGITQYIPIHPGPPPLEQYAPAIPVRVVSPTLLPCAYTLFLTVASNCRRCPATAPPVTYLFLTMWQGLLEEI